MKPGMKRKSVGASQHGREGGPVTRQAAAKRIKGVREAVHSNEPRILKQLLRKRTRVQNGHMVSLMLYAVKEGFTACVEAFLEAGLSHQVVDHQNKPALHWAIQRGHSKIAELLIRCRFKDCGHKALEEAFDLALWYHREDVFKQILQWGLKYNPSCLVEIAKQDYTSNFCKMFLKAFPKCDVNEKTADGESALWTAMKQGAERVVESLLVHGADPNLAVEGGLPPILASFMCIMGLIWNGTEWSKGPKLNSVMRAARGCRRTRNFLGHRRRGRAGFVRFIPRRRWSGIRPISKETATLLVKHGADVTCRDSKGNDALILACRTSRESIARVLLSYGADGVSPRGLHLKTPLHWACMRGCYKLAKLLISRGCDPNAKDQDEHTPLSATAKMLIDFRHANLAAYENYGQFPPGNAKLGSILKTMLDAGADPVYTPPQCIHQNWLSYAFQIDAWDLLCCLILSNTDISTLSSETICSFTQRLPGWQKPAVVVMLHMLTQSGFTHTAKRIVQNIPVGSGRSSYEEELDQMECRPNPLQHLARLTVRKTLGIGMKKKLEKLYLPEQIKSYVRIDALQSLITGGSYCTEMSRSFMGLFHEDPDFEYFSD